MQELSTRLREEQGQVATLTGQLEQERLVGSQLKNAREEMEGRVQQVLYFFLFSVYFTCPACHIICVA